ncbi:MAG: sugar ABC transporter ATP-binding protein, partial [Gemmatimonadetes bacterium]|nr:sugar ABC transporter ATP-binding protein [Gemmatimonadota bacterium]
STLGKLLAGIITRDAGTIELDGREVRFDDPAAALAGGVAMVHQELALCANLTVAENLCLGRMPSRGGFVSWPAMRERARVLLGDVGANLDPARPMSDLSVAEQQLVQIAAAVGSGARIIVFDEPTSSLSEGEAESLYALLGRLKARGVTVLYVSHRMPEIFRLCDTVTVLRDGAHVTTVPTATLDERELVRQMIGRELGQYFPSHVGGAPGEELLSVSGLTRPGRFRDVSFSLRAGEVLGFAGLVGAGRSEVAEALFGLDARATGEVRVRGELVRIGSPRDAMKHGIGLVPEDRKVQGLVLPMKARENVTLPFADRVARRTWMSHAAEKALTTEWFGRLKVRASSTEVACAELSGGNQQKLVLARWLAAGSRVLMLDEPTRGVDVGAKAELHARIDQLAADGHGVLLISSELPELINLSTRILVFRNGRVVGEVARVEATQELLMRLMAGLPSHAATA